MSDGRNPVPRSPWQTDRQRDTDGQTDGRTDRRKAEDSLTQFQVKLGTYSQAFSRFQNLCLVSFRVWYASAQTLSVSSQLHDSESLKPNWMFDYKCQRNLFRIISASKWLYINNTIIPHRWIRNIASNVFCFQPVSTFRSEQTGRYFLEHAFKCILSNWYYEFRSHFHGSFSSESET